MAEPEDLQLEIQRQPLHERIRKLRLEKIELKRKLMALEWIKAFTTVVAFFGIIVTLLVGFNQIKLTREAQVSDRFDRALARISSDKVSERFMGISSLKLFLLPGHEDRYADALYFLINAATFEQDPKAQESIVSAFTNLSSQNIDKSILNQELEVAVERNRALTRALVQVNKTRLRAEETQPQQTQKQVASELLLDVSTFSRLTKEEVGPVDAISNIIAALVHAGAFRDDFSSLFCVDCDFSHTSLKGVKFSDSYLERANFAFADLRNANFQRADVRQANFYHADLRAADLTKLPSLDELNPINPQQPSVSRPTLECADLRGANLSGQILTSLHGTPFSDSFTHYFFTLDTISFWNVKVDKSTIISPFGIVVSLDVPAKENAASLQAIPGVPDLMDSIFGIRTRSFLWSKQGASRTISRTIWLPSARKAGQVEVITLFRAGTISDSSRGFDAKSDSLGVLFLGLESGRWRDATLPTIIAEGIRSLDSDHRGVTPTASTKINCDSSEAPDNLHEESNVGQLIQRLRTAPSNPGK